MAVLGLGAGVGWALGETLLNAGLVWGQGAELWAGLCWGLGARVN